MKALDTYFKAEKGRLSRCAEATGLSPSFLSRIASGERSPGIAALTTIANATGLTVNELLGLEPDTKRRAKA